MTVGVIKVLTCRLSTILAEKPRRKWERLVIFKRDLEQMIDNEAISANYLVLMHQRVNEELGHMIREGEVA